MDADVVKVVDVPLKSEENQLPPFTSLALCLLSSRSSFLLFFLILISWDFSFNHLSIWFLSPMNSLQPLFLSGLSSSYDNVTIQPMVIYNILDHFIRRNENQFRVIGTLVGTINDGIVEVRNSYPVPHTETDQVFT